MIAGLPELLVLAGAGGLLLLSGRAGGLPAGSLPLAALAAAVVLAGRDLLASGDTWGALGRVLVLVGALGAQLLGAARKEPLTRRGSGLLLLAAAGLSLAAATLRLELLLLGWGGAVLATLAAARVAGWVDPPAWRSLLAQGLVGLALTGAGAGAILAATGTARLDRAVLALEGGGEALLAGGLLLALGLLCPPGGLALPRQAGSAEGLPPALAAWLGGPMALAGLIAAARVLVPLAVSEVPGGEAWRLAVAGLGLVIAARGAAGALAAGTVTGLVSGLARAQAGWLALGLAALEPARQGGAWALGLPGAALAWQATALLVAGLAGWSFAALSEEAWGDASLSRAAGLGRRNLWLATWFLLPLLALAGLPPLAGFPGRVGLFVALERLPAWVGVLAVLLLLPGLVAVLRATRVALHRMARPEPEEPLVAGSGLTFACGALGLLTLAIGLAPRGLARALGDLTLP